MEGGYGIEYKMNCEKQATSACWASSCIYKSWLQNWCWVIYSYIVLIFYFTRVHLFLMILSLDPNLIHEPPRFASIGSVFFKGTVDSSFFHNESCKDPSDRTFSWKESILLVGLEELLNHHATATFVSWYSNSYIRSISPHKKIKAWEILGNPPSELAMMVFSIIQKRRSDSLYLSDPQIPIKIHQTRQNDWMFSRKFCCFPGFECFWNLLESRSGFTTIVSKV